MNSSLNPFIELAKNKLGIVDNNFVVESVVFGDRVNGSESYTIPVGANELLITYDTFIATSNFDTDRLEFLSDTQAYTIVPKTCIASANENLTRFECRSHKTAIHSGDLNLKAYLNGFASFTIHALKIKAL